VKFYVSALVGVIIKVILQNARCNNKGFWFIYEHVDKKCEGTPKAKELTP